MTEDRLLNCIIYVLLALAVCVLAGNAIIIQIRGWRNRRQPFLTAPAEAWYKHPGMESMVIGTKPSYFHHITFRTEGGLELKLRVSRDVYYLIPEGAKGTLIWQGEQLYNFTFEENSDT